MKVIIKDGRSRNLYKVEKVGGRFVAYKVNVGMLWDDETRVGSDSTFEGAVAVVKAHAGTSKIEIRPW
ncbi:MAG: hypothetical protein ACFCU3_10690 [Verrucomicrobiales bacterium]